MIFLRDGNGRMGAKRHKTMFIAVFSCFILFQCSSKTGGRFKAVGRLHSTKGLNLRILEKSLVC